MTWKCSKKCAQLKVERESLAESGIVLCDRRGAQFQRQQ
jgi:hypothetical protein